MELSGKFNDGKLSLLDYIQLCDGKELLDGLKLSKMRYDMEHFVPDEKRAILIGNKTYKASAHGLSNLDSVASDVKKMEAFLTEQANFEDANVERFLDKDIDTIKAKFDDLRKWAKGLTYDLEANEEKKTRRYEKRTSGDLLLRTWHDHGWSYQRCMW